MSAHTPTIEEQIERIIKHMTEGCPDEGPCDMDYPEAEGAALRKLIATLLAERDDWKKP